MSKRPHRIRIQNMLPCLYIYIYILEIKMKRNPGKSRMRVGLKSDMTGI